jgi:hypothetical protein
MRSISAAAPRVELPSPELHLLVSAIRAAIDPGAPLPTASSFQKVQCIAFLKLALEHHAGGVALNGLKRLAGIAPAPVITQLDKHAQYILRQRAAGLEELRRIGLALAHEGIEMIPFKGPMLRRRLFADIAAGPSRDLDFLIRVRDIASTLRILAECGYLGELDLSPRQSVALMQIRGQDVLQRNDGRFTVEPHIALAPSNLGLKIDHVGLWQRSRPCVLDGLSIRQPETADEFLMLAVHGSKEGWSRLKWLIDLGAFAKHESQLDWALVSRRAEEQGVRRMVGLAALLLAQVFHVETGALMLHRRDRCLRALALRIVETWERPESGVFRGSIFELCWMRRLLCDRPTALISYFFKTATTPSNIHYALIRLPDSILWAYPLIKVARDYLLLPVWVTLKWLVHAYRAHVASGDARVVPGRRLR